MSSFKLEQCIPGHLPELAQACRFAFNEMQLAIKKDTGNRFVANEKLKVLGFANPAKIEVDIQEGQVDSVNIAVRVSNLGIGPVQGGHVKGVGETFMSKLKLGLGISTSRMTSNIADELWKLADLKEKGLLSDEEFTAAKTSLLG